MSPFRRAVALVCRTSHLLSLMLLFALAPTAYPQAPAQGSPIYGSFDGDGIAHVNLQNLNVNAIFPFVASQGRELAARFSLSYNSSIWATGSSWNPVFNQSGAASWGWQKGNSVGWVDYSTRHAHCTGDPVGLNLGTATYSSFSFVEPDGTRHPFSISYHIPGDCGGTAGGTYTGYATDGSGYYIDANQILVRDRSGLTLTGYGSGLKDTNGNFYSSATTFNAGQTSTTWTDSRGNTALSFLSPNPTGSTSDSYSYYDASGALRTISVDYYQSLSVASNFACSGIIEYSGSATLPSAVHLPNNQTYGIVYESTPGVQGKVTGRIQKITLPSGGYVQFTYGGSNDGINCADGSTLNLTVTRNDGTTSTATQYSRAQVAGVWQTTVTYPQLPYDSVSNQVVVSFDANNHETSRNVYQGNAAGSPLRTINSAWSTTTPITPLSQTLVLEDGTTAAMTETSFDANGNLLATTEHDWGTVTSPGPIVRTTALTYLSSSAYSNLNILNRVTRRTVSDSGGIVRYRQDIAYDGSALSPCPAGVTQHDDTNYGCSMLTRGNPTSITSYTDAATPGGANTKNFHYDLFGNLVQADLDCCQAKTWSYSATTQYAFPDSITRGSLPGTQLTTSATYNASNGSVASATDENGQVMSYAYDSMGRPSTITRPDTTKITYTYDDAHNAISVSNPIQGTAARQTKTTYDGVGRTVKQTVLDASNTSYSIIETQYDTLGRPYRVSNPHNSTAQYWTESRFDALGRPTLVIPPDGSPTANRTAYSYSGTTVTVTDQAGKSIKRQVDGLGRLTKVFEPDGANGNALTQETDMAYSSTDALTTVTQGVQTRNYTYDDLRRLLTARTPETNQLSTTYAYNSFNLLSQRTDARGVVTTYYYDNLNRMAQISYNVGTTGVSATPTVTFTYDEGGAPANAMGRLTTLTDGTGTEKYSFDVLGRTTHVNKTINGTLYPLTYAYNLAGELTSLTYPSGRVVQENYDAVGRLCAVGASGATCTTGTNYANGFSYSPAGRVMGFTYGNSVVASLTYSADRLQLQNLSYTSGAQTLASWNYWYKTDTTNCTNAPAGNNGQIQCITDNVDPGRSVAYGYDSLYRLTSAVTNGSAGYVKWGLSWSYDRYGNRLTQTASFDSPPAGPLTVDATTNRLTGSPYAYDVNGNMTNDGNNTLIYDAENRLLSATNGGASGSYTYDGNNLRVKKVSGSSGTVYIFSGSKVIAEYDNGAAAGSPSREYIYAGSALLAKIDSSGTKYYHQDHLSNRLVTDASGGTSAQLGHYPFGESWYNTSNDKLSFTSYERDQESQNDFAMARYNISRLGRFSAPDRLSGTVAAPQSLNAFAYVQNDPINASDPTGMLMIPGRGFVDASGTGNLSNEFATMEIPVRIGTNYHFEAIEPFSIADKSFGELMSLWNDGQVSLTTEPIYGSVFLGFDSSGGGGGGVMALIQAARDKSRLLLSDPDCAAFLKDLLAKFGYTPNLDSLLTKFDSLTISPDPPNDPGKSPGFTAHVDNVGADANVHVDAPKASDLPQTLLHELFHTIYFMKTDAQLSLATTGMALMPGAGITPQQAKDANSRAATKAFNENCDPSKLKSGKP